MDDAKADMIIASVNALASTPYPACDLYRCDESTARFLFEEEEAA
jgi:hypothetical protein